jgi:septal ring factor EnvC (AmiA/AmiB activator)
VFRRNLIAAEDAYFEKQIAADREELDALEAELKKASAGAESPAHARIEDTRHKLQDKRDQLKGSHRDHEARRARRRLRPCSNS